MNEPRYAPHKLWLNQPTTIPAGVDGGLQLASEKPIPYSFTFTIRERVAEDTETDLIESCVRLVDSDGDVWSGHSIWNVGDFIDSVGSLGWLEGPVFESECPIEWSSPFTDRLFLSGARQLIDDRFYRNLIIGTQTYVIPMKYQGLSLDLAFNFDQVFDKLSLYARLSGFYGGATDDSEMDILPPFIVPIPFPQGMFVNYFSLNSDGFFESGPIPELVRFQRIGSGEPPNPQIRKAE